MSYNFKMTGLTGKTRYRIYRRPGRLGLVVLQAEADGTMKPQWRAKRVPHRKWVDADPEWVMNGELKLKPVVVRNTDSATGCPGFRVAYDLLRRPMVVLQVELDIKIIENAGATVDVRDVRTWVDVCPASMINFESRQQGEGKQDE